MTTKIEKLWDAQVREYPKSIRLDIAEVFAWCDEATTTDSRLNRYIQISMALQYPVHVFYRIDGTRYRGVRFGVEGSEYMGLYSN